MKSETIPYKWSKVANGKGMIAIVTLDVVKSNTGNLITEHYSGEGFRSQGQIEEASVNSHSSWKVGARKGLEFAFTLTESFWEVFITKIEGLSFTDTNPTVVGYTAIQAFLAKTGILLPVEQANKLEEFVASSWTSPYKELIPDFFTLTLSEYLAD